MVPLPPIPGAPRNRSRRGPRATFAATLSSAFAWSVVAWAAVALAAPAVDAGPPPAAAPAVAPRPADARPATDGGSGPMLFPGGHVGGAVRAVAADRGRVYAATGPRVVTWDMTGPDAPTRRGETAPLGGRVAALAVEGGHLYALVGERSGTTFRLTIHRIASPDRLVPAADVALAGQPYDLRAHGDRLYVSAGSGGWLVVDVTAPHQPRVAARLTVHATGTAIDGDHAYIAAPGQRAMVDVRRPDRPVELARFGGLARSVAISGRHILWALAGSTGSILVERLGDGARGAPRAIAELPLDLGFPTRILTDGDRAYVTGARGIHVLDLADPAAIRVLGTLDPDVESPGGLAVAGGRLYAAGGGAGLRRFELTAAGLPRPLAPPAGLHAAHGVAARGGQLFVAAGADGLWTLDASDPPRPRPLARLPLPEAYALLLRGDRAYVAAGRAGLYVVDVTDPARPAVLGHHRTPDEVTGVALAGDLAYLAGGRAGVRVVDVADPAAPRFAGAYAPHDLEPLGIALDATGGWLLVAAGHSGLWSLDLAAPERPARRAFYGTPDVAARVAVHGDTAYVGYAAAGLRAFDVTAPDRPRPLGFLLLPDVRAIAPPASPSDDVVLVAAGREGVLSVGLDAEGRLARRGPAGRVGAPVAAAAAAEGGFVYAAAGDEGLFVLEARPATRAYLPRAVVE